MHPTFAWIVATETQAERLRSTGARPGHGHIAGLQRTAGRVARGRVRIRGGPALRVYLRLIRS